MRFNPDQTKQAQEIILIEGLQRRLIPKYFSIRIQFESKVLLFKK